MGHIVTVMVNGCKVGECGVEASEPGWDRELASAMREATKEAAVVVLEREHEDLPRVGPSATREEEEG